jgi:multiple sugar transport system substrate-binding protein
MRIARRIGLALAIAVSGLATAQAIDVTMWDFLSGGDGVRMKQLVDEFNASQDRIRVETTTSEWGVPFYTKVRTAIVAGQQPDVVTYHLSRFPSAVPQGLLRRISDEELSAAGLSTDDFFPLLVEKATQDGQLYGVPLDTHPIVLFYNKDLLSEMGLLGPDGRPQGFEGVEEFTRTLQQITAETGEPAVVFPTNGSSVWRLWLSLLRQQNGQIMEREEVVVDGAVREALETIVGWAEEGLAARNVESNGASQAIFTSGQTPFMINGVWNVTTFEDASAAGEMPFEYGVMPLPRLYETEANWADSHAFVIPTSPRNKPSDEKVAAVLEFIAFVQQNSQVWASGGHIPAYMPVVNSDEYQTMEPNVHYAPAAENVVYDPDVVIAGAAGPLQQAVHDFITPAVNGQLPTDQALDMFKQAVEELVRNPTN